MNRKPLVAAVKGAFHRQFRGRSRIWRLALYLSLISLILRFDREKPTCDLMFHPAELAQSYVIFGLCVFLLAGLTNWGRLMLGIVIFFGVASQGLVNYRIPGNHFRAVWRLEELHSRIDSSKVSPPEIANALNQYPFDGNQTSGYCFGRTYQRFPDDVVRYTVTARPCVYCRTGQRSYLMDERGSIHYTTDDRAATLQDPLIEQSAYSPPSSIL